MGIMYSRPGGWGGGWRGGAGGASAQDHTGAQGDTLNHAASARTPSPTHAPEMFMPTPMTATCSAGWGSHPAMMI